jgi:3-oxoacyl-[acyl-carrier-protein] synthase I
MAKTSLAIQRTGLVTSVGLTAPTACAAIRAKITNPCETRFIDSNGQWIMAHEVPLEQPWRGLSKLTRMAAMAIEECMEDVPQEAWRQIPLLLCVAEHDRPGRLAGLDDQLFIDIQQLLGANFSLDSSIVAHGRASMAVALAAADKLLLQKKCTLVLIAAADSLLTWTTLSVYEKADRLLTEKNSNGFMPGEAGGAVLLGLPRSKSELRCTGIGFAFEKSNLESGEPLRADGMATAIKQALTDADHQMHDMDYRITDISGEQYYFKEAALAVSRIMRKRREDFDIWHPAECTGETGAASGLAMLAVTDAACRMGYTMGSRIIAHMANDSGQRAAAILEFSGIA